MDEISNKTLATLLVVAIVVSLGGTFISLNRLSNLGGVPAITGFQTGNAQGKVNVTITEQATISTPENLIWFGEGYVETGFTTAELWSNGSKTNWVNASSYMPDEVYSGEGDFIIVQNDGNINVNVTVYSNKNSTEYLCDTDPFCGSNRDANYKFWGSENDSNSCDGQYLYVNSTNLAEILGDGGATADQQPVCGKLRSGNDEDSFRFYVYLKIPDTASGAKNDTLFFTATSSLDQTP